MRKFVLISLIITFCLQLYGKFDSLFELKLKLVNKYKTQKNWKQLTPDFTFNVRASQKGSRFHQGNSLCRDKTKLYVLDNMGSEIVSFNFYGTFQKTEILSGKTPGKVFFPKEMKNFKDTFIIYNSGNIDVFDKSLKHLNRIKVFLTGRRIETDGEFYYIAGNMMYKNKNILLAKLNKKGNVINYLSFKKGFEEMRIGSLTLYKDLLIYTSIKRNYILQVDKDFKIKKTININYDLLNELERSWYKGKNSKHSNWSAMLTSSARVFNDRFFVLLNFPRLEILEMDFSGEILNHYYNDSTFKFMRWMDFEINMENDEYVFFVLGFSIKDDNIFKKYEFRIFKLKPKKGENLD